MPQPVWWTYFKSTAGTEDGQTIAAAAGVTAPQVSRWKSGKNRPSADQVITFARNFNRSPVEALVSTGYITEHDADGLVQICTLPIAEADDAELVDELAKRLDVRTKDYERALVQTLVAVGQLETYVSAMVDGDEPQDVRSIVDHCRVLVYSLHQLTAAVVAEPSRLKTLTAQAAVELRSRQLANAIPENARQDLVSQITAWPCGSNVNHLQLGVDYVPWHPMARKDARGDISVWAMTDGGDLTLVREVPDSHHPSSRSD